MLTDSSLLQRLDDRQQEYIQQNPAYGITDYEEVIQFDIQQLEDAILTILSYIQTHADYINVMQHMFINPKLSKVAVSDSEKRLYNGLGVYGRSKAKRLQKFKEMIDDKAKTVIYPTTPRIDQPVQINTHIDNIKS